MGLDLYRNVKIAGLSPDEAAWFRANLLGEEWRLMAGRKLKARKLPWRAEVTVKGLKFSGYALWPSQRTHIANRMRGIVQETVKSAKGNQWIRNRHATKRAADLRKWIALKKEGMKETYRQREKRLRRKKQLQKERLR